MAPAAGVERLTETPVTGLAATRENVVLAGRSDEVETVMFWEPVDGELTTPTAWTLTLSP